MHHMDANLTQGEKATWELLKNASYCFEQMLEATPHKTAAVQPLNSHLKTKMKKTWKILLEKQEWTHKWHFSMETHKHGHADKNLY